METKKSGSEERLDWSWQQAHGVLGSEKWPLPHLVAKSDVANRADQGNQIKANEYLDEEEVFVAKAKAAADLIKRAKCLVAYTGAGLSRSAGIPDYASKSAHSVVSGPKLQSSLDAAPTRAHCVIAQLARRGLLHHYVQQNHDGLPQKAGFPQEQINEIHGAWFDPSNPVVKFSGNLREDLCSWMFEMEKKADLCLCLGTSLSGMNADRMAYSPAKALMCVLGKQKYPNKEVACKAPTPLGTILVNIQRTPFDTEVGATIRVWGKLDDFFPLLAKFLDLDPEEIVRPVPVEMPRVEVADVFVVPYDKEGKKYTSVFPVFTQWDLRTGSEFRIAPPHASNFNARGKILGKDREGNYEVLVLEKAKNGIEEGVRRRLGRWWVRAAVLCTVEYLPLVNIEPKPDKKAAHEAMVASLSPAFQ